MQASQIAEKAGNFHLNLKNKGLYYLCDLWTSQSIKGKSYDELARTYQVTFCAYTVFPAQQGFLHEYAMRTAEGMLLCDSINMIFIELSKLNKVLEKKVSDMTSLEMWSIFFEYADNINYRSLVNQIIEVKGEVALAGSLLSSISKDERERAIFRSRRMYQTDLESDRATIFFNGKAEGIVEGRAEGEKNKALVVAEKMKANGLSVTDIAEFTELSVDEINNL